MTGATQLAPVEQHADCNSRDIPFYPILPEPTEHPEGDAIRRQVEYYFSDQNLPTDPHLLGLCGGSQNLPVSIGEVMSWRKMRKYRPKSQVIASLKKSNLLEVVNGKRIRRRVPIVLDDEPSDDDLTQDFHEKKPKITPTPRPLLDPAKPWITKGLLKPTGFEDGFCDPPIPPTEFEEEQEIYSPDEPFSTRMEVAIQRFRTRRKFHQSYAKHFTAWMKYGGIETGARQFNGRLDDNIFEERNASERAQILAEHFVSWDKEDGQKWAVDFEGVAKGYLSSQVFSVGLCNEKDIDLATRIMMNFYNYLLHHNVCPEYKNQIFAAHDICVLARTELPITQALDAALPGPFGNACSFIFSGEYAQHYSNTDSWASKVTEGKGMTFEATRVVFTTAVGALGSNAMFDAIDPQYSAGNQSGNFNSKFPGIRSTTVMNTGLEVIKIHLPTSTTLEFYKNAQHKLAESKLSLEPLGKLTCKPWAPVDFAGSDLPYSVDVNTLVLGATYELWLEGNILAKCVEGLKLDCTLRRLEWVDSNGIDSMWYLDSVDRVFCSFYTVLLNELMDRPWKEVVWAKDKKDKETGELLEMTEEMKKATNEWDLSDDSD